MRRGRAMSILYHYYIFNVKKIDLTPFSPRLKSSVAENAVDIKIKMINVVMAAKYLLSSFIRYYFHTTLRITGRQWSAAELPVRVDAVVSGLLLVVKPFLTR